MYYKQKFDTFIRNYDGLGYITSTGIFNDRVVNESGTVFLIALSRKPQSIEQLVDKILPSFIGANRAIITADAQEFYDQLTEDGFLARGETKGECESDDKHFSYNSFDPKTIRKDFSPAIRRADADTQTFLEKHFNGRPHLTSFQIELTSRCNERCVHCYIPHEYKLFDIKQELYYSVLKQLSEMNVLGLTLSGGEPMLHPHFIEFLKAAQKFDFSVNILSNLTLLTDEIIQTMKEVRLSSVQVSLYSIIPEHHDAITKMPGSFIKTRDAILKLIENDIPLQISCPTMKENKDDYLDVQKWAHEHKVRAITDYIMMARYDHTTENLDHRLSLEEVGNVIEDILEDDIDYSNEILKPNFVEECEKLEDNLDDRVCGVGISSCCMIANGNVYPCAGWQDYICGNLNDQPLKEIWESSPKMQYLRNLRKRDFKECIGCKDKAFCVMCMVRNANENPEGNPLIINKHFCKVAALNKKIVLDWRKKNLTKEK